MQAFFAASCGQSLESSFAEATTDARLTTIDNEPHEKGTIGHDEWSRFSRGRCSIEQIVARARCNVREVKTSSGHVDSLKGSNRCDARPQSSVRRVLMAYQNWGVFLADKRAGTGFQVETIERHDDPASGRQRSPRAKVGRDSNKRGDVSARVAAAIASDVGLGCQYRVGMARSCCSRS
jgi:hypothetical protein